MRDPDEGLRTLTELRDAGTEVAVVLAGQWFSGTTGSELLEHVRQLHPHAKRALLVAANAWADEPTAEAIRASMALGRIDHYVLRPAASPDEVFPLFADERQHSLQAAEAQALEASAGSR